MTTVERHIIRLLSRNGYVEIPEIGTLSEHRISAAFDGKTLRAPRTMVSFEPQFSADDSFLIESICREKGIDTETAAEIMAYDIEGLRDSLSCEGSHTIDNLGTFSVNKSEFSFSPSENYHAPGCVYPEIELTPLSVLDSEKKTVPDYAATDEKRMEFMRSLRRAASSAAAIAILVIMTFVLARFPNPGSVTQNASVFNEPASEVKLISPSLSTPEPALVLVFNTPADASCDVEQDIDANVSESNSSESLEIAKSVDDEDAELSEKAYCLVVASLATEADAYLFIEQTDKNLSLLKKDGRFRVYAMEGDTFSSLNRAARDAGLFERYPSAWICKR